MKRILTGAVAAILLLAAPGLSFAAPKFPPLSGRVVDGANILPPAVEAELTGKLANLETTTGRQLVVTTLPSLQGYEIEDYGYQLGRAWKIGSKEDDNGALFIIAPSERKVRIEVGYGLEPILTDAFSSVILQTQVLPRFKQGDMPGGVIAGTDALIAQLAAPEGEAKAAVTQAAQVRSSSGSRGSGWPVIIIVIIFLIIMRAAMGGRRGRSGLGGALPWIILGALNSRSGRGGGWGGGSGGGSWSGGGGGGFSGGGGSFGGGGSSGSW